MAKIEIEVYKNQSIDYDIEEDKFVCNIEIEDNVKNAKRGSLKDMRKSIDDFIKTNVKFKPFSFIFTNSYGTGFGIKKVTAIRTDGKAIVENVGDWKNTSHWRKADFEKCAFYADVDLIKAQEEANRQLEEAQKIHKQKIEQICKRLVPLDLSQYDSFL